MIHRYECCPPGGHRGGFPRECLWRHADDWARRRGYRAVTDSFVQDLARGRVGILSNVRRAVWAPQAYRRVLLAVRLRAKGITNPVDLRWRLLLGGHTVPQHYWAPDLVYLFKRILRTVGDEMPVATSSIDSVPLKLRRQVEQLAQTLDPTMLPGLSRDAVEWLGSLQRDPKVIAFATAYLDLVMRGGGPRGQMLARFEGRARGLLGEVVDEAGGLQAGTALEAGALMPVGDVNVVTEALERAIPDDIRMADAVVCWLPSFIGSGRQTLAGEIDPRLLEVWDTGVRWLTGAPERRLLVYALLTQAYARYRLGEIDWVPGVEFLTDEFRPGAVYRERYLALQAAKCEGAGNWQDQRPSELAPERS